MKRLESVPGSCVRVWERLDEKTQRPKSEGFWWPWHGMRERGEEEIERDLDRKGFLEE